MTVYSLEPPEVLLKHFGKKGMRWGVRRESKKAGTHPSIVKYGKESVRKHRKLRVKYDHTHIDAKTGRYTHNNKVAKAARTVDKVMDVAGGLTTIAANSLL